MTACHAYVRSLNVNDNAPVLHGHRVNGEWLLCGVLHAFARLDVEARAVPRAHNDLVRHRTLAEWPSGVGAVRLGGVELAVHVEYRYGAALHGYGRATTGRYVGGEQYRVVDYSGHGSS